jgi:hypothetical protein
VKNGPSRCIIGDEVLEQRQIKKAKSDKVPENQGDQIMGDFLYEFDFEI